VHRADRRPTGARPPPHPPPPPAGIPARDVIASHRKGNAVEERFRSMDRIVSTSAGKTKTRCGLIYRPSTQTNIDMTIMRASSHESVGMPRVG